MIEIKREFSERGRFCGLTIKTEAGQKMQVICTGARKGYVGKIIHFDKAGSCRCIWDGGYMRGRSVEISDDLFYHSGVRVYGDKQQKLTKIEVGQDVTSVKMDGVLLDEATLRRNRRKIDPYDSKLVPQTKTLSDLIIYRAAILSAVKKCEDEKRLKLIRAVTECQDEAKFSFLTALFGLHESQQGG